AYHLIEYIKASKERGDIWITNQLLLINGIIQNYVEDDITSVAFYDRQQKALSSMPDELKNISTYVTQLAPFNIDGIENMKRLFDETFLINENIQEFSDIETPHLQR